MWRTSPDPDTEADPAAGDQEPESFYYGHDREEKKMQEEKLVELLGNLMSTACDNCSKIQDKTQEKSDEICAECPAGEQVCAILNENQRYSEVVLCCECEYGAIAVEVNEERLYLCRLREGLGGFVNLNSGCSRGKRV